MRFNSVLLLSVLSFGLLFGTSTQAHSLDCSTPKVQCSKAISPAVDNLGQLWLAFVQQERIYLQKQHADHSWEPPVAVDSVHEPIAHQGEDRLKLVFGPKGEIFLSWTTPLSAPYSGNIRFTRSLNHGKTFDPPRTINQDGLVTAHRFSAMKVNNLGEIFIAWIDKRDHFDPANKGKKPVGAAIYFNYSKDHGKSFQAKDQAITKVSCECCRLAMGIDQRQQPLVLFRSIFAHSERDHALVRFQRYQPQAPERVDFSHWHLQGCPHQGPAILQARGITHMLWFSKKQLSYRRQLADGTLSEPILMGGAGSQHPSLAYVNGVLYLVYQQYSQKQMRIWLKSSSDQGQSWSKAQQLASTSAGSDYPLLVVQGDDVQLLWLTQKEGLKQMTLTQPQP